MGFIETPARENNLNIRVGCINYGGVALAKTVSIFFFQQIYCPSSNQSVGAQKMQSGFLEHVRMCVSSRET